MIIFTLFVHTILLIKVACCRLDTIDFERNPKIMEPKKFLLHPCAIQQVFLPVWYRCCANTVESVVECERVNCV